MHKTGNKCSEKNILAHRIRINNILTMVKSSYLIQAVIGCIGTHGHGRNLTTLFSQNDDIK